MYEIEKKITDAIEIIVKNYMSKLQYNSSIRAKVTVVNGDGTYAVSFNGQSLSNIKARAGVSPSVNSLVYLCVPNQILSDMFIDCIIP